MKTPRARVAADAGAAQSSAASLPVVVVLPPPTDEPSDCAAQGPAAGVFDERSTKYARLEIRRGKQVVEEKVVLADGDTEVELQLGGCAHYAAHYTVRLAGERDVSDRAHYLERALRALEGLDFQGGEGPYVKDLAELIRPLYSRPAELEECSFPHGDMTQIDCSVSGEDGRVVVSLSYDIVL